MGGCAKERFRLFPLTKLKQAFSETDTRIVQRLDRQRAAVKVRGPCVVAVPDHRTRKSHQSVVMRWLRGMNFCKHFQRPDTFVAVRQNIAQGKLQIGRLWLERQPAFGDGHRLIKVSGLAQLECQFNKCRKVMRPPGDGAAQMIERLVTTADRSEHARKQSFDGWLIGPARKLGQMDDGFVETVLRHQGASQDLRGKRVATVGFQDLRRQLLSISNLLHLQRQHRLCERGIGWPASFWRKAL